MKGLIQWDEYNSLKHFAALLLLVFCCSCSSGELGDRLKNVDDYKYPLCDSLRMVLTDLYDDAASAKDYATLEKCVKALVRHYNDMNDGKSALLLAHDYLDRVMASGDSLLIPAAYYYAGVVYFNRGLPSYAMDFFTRMFDYPLDKRMECKVYYALGETARSLVSPNGMDPLEYYRRVERLARELDDSVYIANALFGQSQVFFDSMGAYQIENFSAGMRDSLALGTRLLEGAVAYSLRDPNPIFLGGLSLNYAAMGMFDKAISYRDTIVSYRSIPKYKAFTYNCVAAIAGYMKDYDEIIRLGTEAFESATDDSRNFDLHHAADLLAFAYKRKGDYEKAFGYFERMRGEELNLNKDEGDVEILALQVKFDLKTKESLIAAQRMQLVFGLLLALVLVGALIVVVFFYREKEMAYRNLVRQLEAGDLLSARLDEEMEEKSELYSLLPSEQAQEVKMDKIFVRLSRVMKEKLLFVDSRISRRSLALQVGVNERTLFDCIKKHGGASFSEYIISLRLAHARELLAQPDDRLSIEGIALNSGFGSRASFYRVFRSCYGLSPDEFRKIARKGLQDGITRESVLPQDTPLARR